MGFIPDAGTLVSCRRSRRVADQLTPVRESQEMRYPGYAGLETRFRKIQSLCDVTITEALASQVIHRAQQSYLFPKGTQEVNLHAGLSPF